MRYVKVDDITPDMRFAKPLLLNGMRFANENVLITEKFKDRMISAGIGGLYIKDKMSEGIVTNELISDETWNEMVKTVQSVYTAANDVNIQKKGFSEREELDKLIMLIRHGMIEEIKDRNLIDCYYDTASIRTTKNWLYVHAVNVTLLSLLIGKELHYDVDQLEDLALAAALHEIGLYKNLKETDAIQMAKNLITAPLFGRKWIRTELPTVSVKVSNSIFMVHERLDGSGYPNSFTDKQIDNMTRIISIADEFDKHVSCDKFIEWDYTKDRTTKEGINHVLELAMSNKLDFELVKVFIGSIMPYQVGTGILLSNDRQAIVVKNHKNLPERPVIRYLDSKEDIDLATELLNVTIVRKVII